MKKIIVSLFILFVYTASVSAQRVFQNEEYGVLEIADRTWMIHSNISPNFSSVFVIEGNDKALVIDTGDRFEDLTSLIRMVTDKPLTLVLTHMHGDHTGSINEFDNLYYHPADSAMGRRALSNFEGEVNYVYDGYVFDLGGKQIEVKHMPGHTAGSIILNDYDTGISFTGDAFGSRQVWLQISPFENPISMYVETTQNMLDLMGSKGLRYIYTGHYGQVNCIYGYSYIEEMNTLAKMLLAGEAESVHHDRSSETSNTLMTSYRGATIVFNPDRVK